MPALEFDAIVAAAEAEDDGFDADDEDGVPHRDTHGDDAAADADTEAVWAALEARHGAVVDDAVDDRAALIDRGRAGLARRKRARAVRDYYEIGAALLAWGGAVALIAYLRPGLRVAIGKAVRVQLWALLAPGGILVILLVWEWKRVAAAAKDK